jgi:hypothetical protein
MGVKPMKNQAAVKLGRKGGLARKKNLTPEQLSAIGKRAAAARWKKHKAKKNMKKVITFSDVVRVIREHQLSGVMSNNP